MIVGTHADEVVRAKQNPATILQNLKNMICKNPNIVRQDILDVVAVSMATGYGLKELKALMVETALAHPLIGISKVTVSRPIEVMQERVNLLVRLNRLVEKESPTKAKYYMEWSEFEALCFTKDILVIYTLFAALTTKTNFSRTSSEFRACTARHGNSFMERCSDYQPSCTFTFTTFSTTNLKNVVGYT